MDCAEVRTVTLDELKEARSRIGGLVRETPLLECPFLSELAARPVFLKPENLQLTGSFKIRGGANHVLALEGVGGVVTASSGNHGQAVAYAAREAGLPCTVVVPEDAVKNKVEAIQRWGAAVMRHGTLSSERKDKARALAREERLSFIDSTDDLLVIAGQGTLALEILEQLPEVETIVTPIGGGGLISGISAAAKLQRPETRVVGVEPEGSAAMYRSVEAGRRVTLEEVSTVADGLRTSRPGPLTFAHVTAFVDEILLADEGDIIPLMLEFLEKSKLMVEPSGVVGATAAARGLVPGSGPLVVVLSGGNVDLGFVADCIRDK